MADYEGRYYTFRSGSMLAVAIMFALLFGAGSVVLLLMVAGVINANTPKFILAGVTTSLVGLAAWNMEVGIELHPEGLNFTRLVKPSTFVAYSRIQRMSIRMLRGWYYCFMRFGNGLLSGTFFPVGYWMREGKEETNAFLREVANRANLVQAGKTPFGAPIYVKPAEERFYV